MKASQSSSKQLEEERFRLEKDLARLEARFDASLQQLKDREEVSCVLTTTKISKVTYTYRNHVHTDIFTLTN